MRTAPAAWIIFCKRIAFVAVVLYGSWMGMMLLHEAGHVLHSWLSGGQVLRVVIPALGFSRTELGRNPRPLFVAWGGPMWGSLLPAAIVGVLKGARLRDRRIPLFFLGFCLIANGTYLAAGLPLGAGDAGDLVRLGAPPWSLLLFGTVTIPAGFYCWHLLGSGMGLRGCRRGLRARCEATQNPLPRREGS